jgi:hypothetical protein
MMPLTCGTCCHLWVEGAHGKGLWYACKGRLTFIHAPDEPPVNPYSPDSLACGYWSPGRSNRESKTGADK